MMSRQLENQPLQDSQNRTHSAKFCFLASVGALGLAVAAWMYIPPVKNALRAGVTLGLVSASFSLFQSGKQQLKTSTSETTADKDSLHQDSDRSLVSQSDETQDISPQSNAIALNPEEENIADNESLSSLVRELISINKKTRQLAISKATEMSDREALDAVETAIQYLTGKPDIEFYQPGGIKAIEPQKAYESILQLACEGKILEEPVLVQSMIPQVSFLNQNLMTELEGIDAKYLTIYQLLGVQMQLDWHVRVKS